MTFDPAIPLQTASPGLFPAQNQANMAVINANMARDHQFNNTPNALPPTDDTGFHTLIHMIEQAPSGALSSTGRLYVKTVSGNVYPFYMDDSGVAQQLAGAFTAASTGSVTLPGGIIMKWGKISSTSTTNSVSFATAFPNALFNVQMTVTISSGSTTGHSGSVYVVDGASFTTTGFTWRQADRSLEQTGFYWVALGN